jgi:hypothetical protein
VLGAVPPQIVNNRRLGSWLEVQIGLLQTLLKKFLHCLKSLTMPSIDSHCTILIWLATGLSTWRSSIPCKTQERNVIPASSRGSRSHDQGHGMLAAVHHLERCRCSCSRYLSHNRRAMVDDPNVLASGWDDEEVSIRVSGYDGLEFIFIVCIVTGRGSRIESLLLVSTWSAAAGSLAFTA